MTCMVSCASFVQNQEMLRGDVRVSAPCSGWKGMFHVIYKDSDKWQGQRLLWNDSVGPSLSSQWELTLLGSDKGPFPCAGTEKDTRLCLPGSLFLHTCQKVVDTTGGSLSAPSLYEEK